MSSSRKFGRQCLLVVSICIAMGGCAAGGTDYLSSNVVSYLYPNQNQPEVQSAEASLTLPLRMGLAFVPEQGLSHQALTERDKAGLKTTVATFFEQQSFVDQVTLVPSAYLRPGGSFANLDQLQKMYDIDVIVLLSYDRTQFASAKRTSTTYWTLGGAQLISGEINTTHTLLDAAAYDIAERQMLFRAPGSSLVQQQRGEVGLAEQVRQDSLAGFEQASVDLMSNLRQQMRLFTARLGTAAAQNVDETASNLSGH